MLAIVGDNHCPLESPQSTSPFTFCRLPHSPVSKTVQDFQLPIIKGTVEESNLALYVRQGIKPKEAAALASDSLARYPTKVRLSCPPKFYFSITALIPQSSRAASSYSFAPYLLISSINPPWRTMRRYVCWSHLPLRSPPPFLSSCAHLSNLGVISQYSG